MINYRLLDLKECKLISDIDRRESIFSTWSIEDGKWILKYEHFEIFDWEGSEQRYVSILENILSTHGKIFGAFDSGRLIGFAALEKDSKLQAIFIDVNYRNKGIGTKLLSFCKIQARCWGAKKIYLSSDNSEACIKFFLSQGARLVEQHNKKINLKINLFNFYPEVNLSPIDSYNWKPLSNLTVKPEQKKLYPISNLSWLTINSTNDTTPTIFSVEIDGYPVGIIGYINEEDDNSNWINPFMIDKSFQNKKLGGKALKAIIEIIKNSDSLSSIKVNYNKNNIIAESLYRKHNFYPILEGSTHKYCELL
ncbi:GNAT family N-acetyltransferase [Cetobacterium sp. 2A]|uniref:GNAT family N-acetyltransferase n=1 Tax=Cetobacterium sp. 2A TaxID=2754723 RepID=UPI00163B8E32|nr:GNAT family N-acetyltransferase [Cetobacterium sp. 2A]MBC2855510.1 GNAT family N-acetyltransferase [Cetobacterium sp. 2A]